MNTMFVIVPSSRVAAHLAEARYWPTISAVESWATEARPAGRAEAAGEGRTPACEEMQSVRRLPEGIQGRSPHNLAVP